MSLESKIEALTSAIEKQTALLEKGLSARSAAKATTGDPAAAPSDTPDETAAKPKPAAKKTTTAAKGKKPTKTQIKKMRDQLAKDVLANVKKARKEGDADEQAKVLAWTKDALVFLGGLDETDNSHKVSAIADDRVVEAVEVFTKIFEGEDPELPEPEAAEAPDTEEEDDGEMSF